MKYLRFFLYTAAIWSVVSMSCTVTLPITAQSFDTLYPMTVSTYLVQQCMHVWQDIKDLQNKNGMSEQAYEYAYNAVIGQLVYIYDLLHTLADSAQQAFSDDTSAYCVHIVEQMIEDAKQLELHGDTLLYVRLIKQLNKIMTVLTLL